jgi:thiol-disulfide isomerase/thioredoxin
MLTSKLALAVVAFGLLTVPVASMAHAATPAENANETAQTKMAAAESRATVEHKNLLVDFGASWCPNCRLFDRFWSDPQMHPLLSRAFVLVDLDIDEHDARHPETPGGYTVLHELGGSKNSGLPYLAIATERGKLIISDETKGTPESGIGYPDAPDEIAWFMHMLERGAPALTATERQSILQWLQTHGSHSHR